MSDPFEAMHRFLVQTLGEAVTVRRGNASPVTLAAIVRQGLAQVGEHGRVSARTDTLSMLCEDWPPQRGDVFTVRGADRPVAAILADDGFVVEVALHG